MSLANRPYSVIAKQSLTFVEAGLNSSNLTIIYRVSGNLVSYKPERPINGIDSFVSDLGYYIVPKVDIDLSAYVSPPLPNGEDIASFKYVYPGPDGVLIG